MTQVVLNIDSKKKWNALKTILDVMNIEYMTQDSIEKMSERELELLHQAENDKEHGRLNTYTSHRDILGR
jgi:hypothetical protein